MNCVLFIWDISWEAGLLSVSLQCFAVFLLLVIFILSLIHFKSWLAQPWDTALKFQVHCLGSWNSASLFCAHASCCLSSACFKLPPLKANSLKNEVRRMARLPVSVSGYRMLGCGIQSPAPTAESLPACWELGAQERRPVHLRPPAVRGWRRRVFLLGLSVLRGCSPLARSPGAQGHCLLSCLC